MTYADLVAPIANRVFLGSCERMTEIPDGVVHTCVTSPPYYGLRDYGVDGQIGLEDSLEAFIDRLVGVFREVRRVLRDDGTAWVNLGDSYASRGTRMGNSHGSFGEDRRDKHSAVGYRPLAGGFKEKDLMGVPWRLAFALQSDGWWLRDAIVWAKPNPMPASVSDRCTPAYEFVFMLAKRSRYVADMDAVRTPIDDNRPYKTPDGWDTSKGSGAHGAFVRGGRESGSIDNPAKARWRDPNEHHARYGVYEPSDEARNPDRHDGGRGRFPAAMGANLRNVWTIATEAYSEAHFATFPAELPARCIRIGASEAGCCAECGAPRVRQTDVSYDAEGRTTNGPRSVDRKHLEHGSAGFDQRLIKTTTTRGFERTCEHDAPTIPTLALDPFMGSGTTAEVATSLGRRFVGYELNPEYHALIAERTRQLGLFSA